MKRDNTIYTVVFSFSITFIFVLLLALAHQGTKAKVAQNAKISEAMAFLLASGYKDIDASNAEKLFNENFIDIGKGSIWTTEVEGEKIYISKFQGNALWGSVQGVFAVNDDLTRIIGMEITSHNETPGLGGRIEERWFLDQLKGERLDEDFRVIMGSSKGDYDMDNGYIDGITGATRTSESIETIVLTEYKNLQSMIGGE